MFWLRCVKVILLPLLSNNYKTVYIGKTSTLKKKAALEVNEVHAVERNIKTFMSCPREVGL